MTIASLHQGRSTVRDIVASAEAQQYWVDYRWELILACAVVGNVQPRRAISFRGIAHR
jgi:hypothetical protein